MKIVLITACLAGVAQSKMAAVAIKKEVEARGFEISIEEQGGHKVTVRLSQEQIDTADVVIVAKAITISGRDRFRNKKVFETEVNKALRDPKGTVDKALEVINQK
ncbi:MAG: PTS fructose transporter subunit IIBC [Bacteroidales bacterium]|nr:MAG: PTS fructose transporter subunit IIBC [Bacteroidales bacterium]